MPLRSPPITALPQVHVPSGFVDAIAIPALASRWTTLTDDGSNFDSNVAVDDGGAVYAYEGSSIDLTDSSFTDNASGGVGGALALQADGSLTCLSVFNR